MNLSDYLHQFKVSVPEFAKKVGVSYQTVYRWLDKTREPKRHYQKIFLITRGEVTPNDFLLTHPANKSQANKVKGS